MPWNDALPFHDRDVLVGSQEAIARGKAMKSEGNLGRRLPRSQHPGHWSRGSLGNVMRMDAHRLPRFILAS